MAGTIEMFRRSVEEFGRRVTAVNDEDLGRPTPCTEWDVRALLHHLVYEELWAPPLLRGATMAEIGDRFEGDILGSEYHSAWKEAAAGALDAATAEVLDRTVHLSFGDFPGGDYLGQLTADHVIHAWDLARALGADETLPPDLVTHVYDFLAPQADQWQAAGVFAAPVEVPADADPLTKLLALTGRAI